MHNGMTQRVPAGEKGRRRLCRRWLWSGIAERYAPARSRTERQKDTEKIPISDDRFACYSEKYGILDKALFVRKERKEVVPRTAAF